MSILCEHGITGFNLWTLVVSTICAVILLLIVNAATNHLHVELVVVYNFVVEDCHTYFVGDGAIWVHNKRCGRNIPEKY